VVQLHYDSTIINFEQLLEVFFYLHNPTQLNRQGNDVGTQYRSAIFFHQPEQQQQSQNYCQQLRQNGVYDQPIVTEITAASQFFPAEDYHQGYVWQNPQQPYCQFLIAPKLATFNKKYAAWLKS
jgi:peptide-methionine (S)-S-oxide reductase